MAHLCIGQPQPDSVWKRDWRFYSKDKLGQLLAGVDWSTSANDVQWVWDDFENKVIKIVDVLVPLSEFVNDKVKCKPNSIIKRKLNVRKILLKQLKCSPTGDLKIHIKNLNVEIRSHFFSEKKK